MVYNNKRGVIKMKKLLVFFTALITMLCVSCKKDDYKLNVIAPSGAPGVALAELATNHSEDYNIELNKTADVLKAAFTAAEADVIIAPINLGVTFYNKTSNYQIASVLTWGNLYFAKQGASLTIEDLNGKDLILFGEGTINDVIVKKVLADNNITLGEGTTYLADTQKTNAQLISNPDAIVLVAEPILSAAKMQKEIATLSVQDLYSEDGGLSYPQAACFIKKDTIDNHKKVVDKFIDELKESADLCESNASQAAQYAAALELGKAPILTNALPNCNISFKKAIDVKSAIEKVVNLKLAMFGGKLPTDEFYYE